ncbi:hypothetical protein BLS_007395 [Venturia inaequalis]|uniref:C2H2-type domain-containing protein n=1 Tax=Venturia inaequalis TaxID=5025 RepID=A0A8H3UA03_VENIN|nr:hypothetical protein BLS_007395 [Venturia inaequalis]
MGSNDHYPYYYSTDQANAHAQSNYSAYQARPSSTQQVPATQYTQQHARTNSAHTSTSNAQQNNYPDYQQNQQTTQSYPEQNNWYGGATGNYGSQRAAEALSRLGSTTEQTRSTSATAGQTYSGTASSTGGYAQSGSNHIQPPVTPTVQYPSAAVQNQTQQSYAGSTYGLNQQASAQARPSSVNSVRSAGMAPQRSPVTENVSLSGQYQAQGAQQRVQMAHHRSASPAQIQASRHLQSLQADQRAAAAVAASGPYPPPSNRVLPNVTQPARPNPQPTAPAYSYNQNSGTQSNANAQQNNQFDQPTTIDPSAIYDAWPEHQKRLEAIRAAKALDNARIAAEEEKKKAEEVAKAEEDRKRVEAEAEAKMKADEEKKIADKARKKADAARRRSEAKAKKNASPTEVESSTAASQPDDPEKEDAEEQIRQLMAKVKAMNDKHPTLLAKIWEQERQQHLETSQSPQAGAMSPPPPQPQQPLATQQPPPSGQKQSLGQKQSSAQKQLSKKGGDVNGSVSTPSRPISAQSKSGAGKPTKGTTVWPKEKKGQLAKTAASLLNAIPENAGRTIEPEEVSEMLDRNPTYIELPYFNGTGESLPAEMRPPTPVSGPSAEKPSAEKVKKTSKAGKAAEAKKAASEEVKEISAEPATKKDAARKRNFNDLVDLTSLSDDDIPANKRLYQGPPPVTMPGQYQPVPNFMGDFDPQSIVSPYLQQGASQWMSQNGHAAPYAPQYPPVHRPAPVINERHRTVELAQPLNSKKAKKVISYDVKTIARDVLLATGKHPDMLPLNGHLEPLKNIYPKQIDHLSDLTTIRWDILDPGEPVSLDSDDKDSVIADGDADDESDHEPAIPRPAVVRATVGVGGGSGEIMVSAHHRAPVKGTFGTLTPKPHRGRGRPPKSAYVGSTGSQGVRQRPFGFENGETPQPRSGQPYQRGDDADRRQSAAARPNNQYTIASGSGTPANSNRQFSTPLSAPAGSSGGVGYAALRQVQVDENGNPIKKKGRPVGWRKNLHQAGVGLLAGGSGDPNMGKKKAADVSAPPPPVTYAEYACKWDGCRARLHNLATLKKHVNKVHGRPDPKGCFTCKWEGCPKMIQVADKDTGEVREMPQYHHFPNQELMLEHVDKAHVGPIAWKLGDGPPDGLSDVNATDSEAYLSDAKGRRVTPRISEPPPSATPFSFGKQKKKTAEQLAREAEDEYRKKKREIGPGVDRGGSRLVTPKRRQGFVDDEDGDEVMVDQSD